MGEFAPAQRGGYPSLKAQGGRSGAVADSNGEEMPQLDSIDDLLSSAHDGASDLHVTSGHAARDAFAGSSASATSPSSWTPNDRASALPASSPREQQKPLRASNRHIDLAYSVPGVARFRVNVFMQREAIGAAFRMIPHRDQDARGARPARAPGTSPTKPRGLVLVTGPTGSGKSTTLAAMIDLINRTRPRPHHHHRGPDRVPAPAQRCIVNQREIGTDATASPSPRAPRCARTPT